MRYIQDNTVKKGGEDVKIDMEFLFDEQMTMVTYI